MNIVNPLIQLACGAAGGNLAGSLFKNLNLGTLGNSLAGIVGGGLGGQILQRLIGGTATGDATDLTSIVSSVVGGGIGGTIVLAIVGLIKNAMGRTS
jgi:uncharacterized membrane protein YeaQ/YmgE (transglycosylase-associated protein family)